MIPCTYYDIDVIGCNCKCGYWLHHYMYRGNPSPTSNTPFNGCCALGHCCSLDDCCERSTADCCIVAQDGSAEPLPIPTLFHFLVYRNSLVQSIFFDPLSGLLGIISKDDVRACSLEASQSFHDDILFVQPSSLTSSLDHCIFSRNMVGGNRKI